MSGDPTCYQLVCYNHPLTGERECPVGVTKAPGRLIFGAIPFVQYVAGCLLHEENC